MFDIIALKERSMSLSILHCSKKHILYIMGKQLERRHWKKQTLDIKMKKKLSLKHISQSMYSLLSSFIAAVIPVADKLIIDQWTANWISDFFFLVETELVNYWASLGCVNFVTVYNPSGFQG